MKMIYRLPQLGDQEILQEYVREHRQSGESSISASHALTSSDYAEWVERIQNNAIHGGEDWGRSLLYLCFDENRLVGLLSIRYELPEELTSQMGDIGYGVRPSERNKGYATAMLRHALNVCREKWMKRVVLGCYKDNVASVKVIRKCGGLLAEEGDNYSEGRVSQYFRIEL